FFVKDGETLWGWFVRMWPRTTRPPVEAVGESTWRILGGYVRGVGLTALFDAVCIGIALAIIGVPLVVPLALLTFVAAFLPIIRSVTAGRAPAPGARRAAT